MDRRRFLAATLGTLAAPATARAVHGLGPCVHSSHGVRLTGPGEPGDPLRVVGRVFAPDGSTPAAGVTVYAYQTDVTGYYHPRPGHAPRLRGWLTTDGEGRFEYATIRPAPYPGRATPAHIHHQLWGGGWPAQYASTLVFDGDPLITADERRRSAAAGRFGWVGTLQPGADGIPLVHLALRLETEGDSFEDNTRHGLEPCGLA